MVDRRSSKPTRRFDSGHKSRLSQIPPIAEDQAGVFTRKQARQAGFTSDQVHYRTRKGLWVPAAGQALCAAGTQLTVHQGGWAAWLTWPDAILWGPSALVWQWPKVPRMRLGAVIVSLPTARRRQRNLIPRVVVMDGEEVVHGPGGMMQRPELAAVDALAFLDKPAAEALFAWLVTRHKFSPERFSLVVASREGRRGVEELRRYDLMMQLGVASTFEFDTVTLLLDAGFKDFETNATIELPGYPQFCVDILFRYKKTIVECDGRRYHQHDEAFETDRARDRALQASGYKVLRVTWRTIHEEPEAFLAELRAALA